MVLDTLNLLNLRFLTNFFDVSYETITSFLLHLVSPFDSAIFMS